MSSDKIHMFLPDNIQREYLYDLKYYLMTTRQVAAMLGCTRQFVESLRKRGRLRPALDLRKDGGCMVFLQCDVLDYMLMRDEEKLGHR